MRSIPVQITSPTLEINLADVPAEELAALDYIIITLPTSLDRETLKAIRRNICLRLEQHGAGGLIK